LQSEAAAQEKENAVPAKPKNSGKKNDSSAGPRKTQTLASSGASPRLLKKALGQISLNSPRANQRVVVASLSKKPFLTSATASPPEKTSPQVKLYPGASSKDASTAAEVRQNSEAADADAGVGAARGRPSMMVVTANPRLQEVSALPRGKVLRVKLFAEQNEDEEDELQGEAHVSAAAAAAAAAAAESAGNENAEEQRNQGSHDGVVEDRSEAVQSPQQDRDEAISADSSNHDKTEAAICEQDIVPPAEAGDGEEQQAKILGSSLLPEQGHDDGEQQKDDVTAASVVVEESQGDKCLGYAAPAAPSKERVDREDSPAQMPAQQSNEVAVATGKAPEDIEEEAAGAVRKGATSYTRSEGEGTTAVAGLQHVGLVVDEETRELVEGSKYLQFADDERRVLCTLTGKKIAPVYDGILLHLGSRKVQQLMVEGPFVMAVSTSKY